MQNSLILCVLYMKEELALSSVYTCELLLHLQRIISSDLQFAIDKSKNECLLLQKFPLQERFEMLLFVYLFRVVTTIKTFYAWMKKKEDELV